jgi:signal transduction histidine kinase
VARQFLDVTKPIRRHRLDAMTIRKDERSRIAREIHDELGQRLVMLKFEVASLAKLAASESPVPLGKVALINELIDGAVQSIRSVTSGREPAFLHDRGVIAALDSLCRDFQRSTGIECTFVNQIRPDVELNRPTSLAIFRIVQASLTNVLRHAQAGRAVVTLGRTNTQLVLTIRDNGAGITPGADGKLGALGIRGMRERVAGLGGSFSIKALDTGGTEIKAYLSY